MTTPPEYFDVNAENFDGPFECDPAEQKVPGLDGREDEIAALRDSVLNEPCFTGHLQQTELAQWIQQKKAKCTIGSSLAVTLAAALAAGPFAVLGAFMTGRQTAFAVLYSILFAPVIEELLKQSGMIYLLEKKPYRLFSVWQFIVAGAIAGAVFAAIENLLYLNLYIRPETLQNPPAYAQFRWTVCTGLHVTCSVIASLGLGLTWRHQLAYGRAADLSHSFWPFALAMMLHAGYNLTVILINPQF